MNQPPAPLKPAVELAAKRRPLFPDESVAYARAREALLADEIEFRRAEHSVIAIAHREDWFVHVEVREALGQRTQKRIATVMRQTAQRQRIGEG